MGGPGGRTRQELRTTMPGPPSRPHWPSTGTRAGKCPVPTLWTGHWQTTPGRGRCGLGGRRQAGGHMEKNPVARPELTLGGSHCGVWDTAARLLLATAMSPLRAALGAGSPSSWKGLWGVLPCSRTTWVAGRPALSLPAQGRHTCCCAVGTRVRGPCSLGTPSGTVSESRPQETGSLTRSRAGED